MRFFAELDCFFAERANEFIFLIGNNNFSVDFRSFDFFNQAVDKIRFRLRKLKRLFCRFVAFNQLNRRPAQRNVLAHAFFSDNILNGFNRAFKRFGINRQRLADVDVSVKVV